MGCLASIPVPLPCSSLVLLSGSPISVGYWSESGEQRGTREGGMER